MNTITEAAENRFSCAVFALVFFAFIIFIIWWMRQANAAQRTKMMVEATLKAHTMTLPEMECPRCLREGRQGHLRVFDATCVDKLCGQQFRIVWGKKYGTLIPKDEADLEFLDWADGEELIIDELKRTVEG